MPEFQAVASFAGAVAKVDEDQHLVFGWASVCQKADGTEVVDSQGDVIEIDDLAKAAYEFVLESRVGGEMHVAKGVSTLVESMVFTPEKIDALGLPPGSVPHGWFVGFKVEDEGVWDLVKSGQYPAFSIGGSGIREAMEDG